MKYLDKNLCSLVRNDIITILMNSLEFSSIEIHKDRVLVGAGYDNQKDEIIWQDWANKQLDPIFFMRLIFENEEIF